MRDRLALPFLLPIMAIGTILLAIFSFGYVLLEVQETRPAWPVAIVVAGVILLIASLLAVRPNLRGWPVYTFTALPAAVILATGLFFLIRPAPGGEGEAVVAIPPPGPLDEIATDNRFSVNSFTIVANQQYTLNLTNQGAALHNWHLRGVAGPDGRDVQTRLLSGGQSETIQFTVPQPGTYDFLCDVHPVEMVGRLTVVEEGAATAAGGAAGGGSPGPGKIVSIATDNKFSPVDLVANANETTSLTLENRGTQLHNWHLRAPDTDGKEPQTKLLPGGQSETIQFRIVTPGTYDYLCDVHPVEMKGRLTVR